MFQAATLAGSCMYMHAQRSVALAGRNLSPGTKPSELLRQAIQPPDMANIKAAVKNLADIGAITCMYP